MLLWKNKKIIPDLSQIFGHIDLQNYPIYSDTLAYSIYLSLITQSPLLDQQFLP